MIKTIYRRMGLLAIVVGTILTGVATSAASAAGPRGGQKGGTFTLGQGTFLLNGEPFVVKAAEVHYPRIPRPYWEHRIEMCRALGMNTLCLYVFWNIHEQREGQFDFTGQNDVAAFCRLAQKHGMYVIVRPGPYVCAEWEMGGLPWWLLKKKGIRLREQDPYFMERVRIFEQQVAAQLAPLTIQRGGPIIMVQVENEYGSYGEDKAYVSAIRDIVAPLYATPGAAADSTAHGAAATDGTRGPLLFQCDWSSNFEKNGLDDLLWTMNFGTGANIDQQFRRLGELRPTAPKMCSEFWSGWFDKWGARHETRPARQMVDGIDEMLQKGISFSLYMTHGGTSFGHWAGANSPGFAPDVTSYDYDAPVSESGLATEKYYELRQTMQRHTATRLPDVPRPPMGTVAVERTRLDEFAPLTMGAGQAAEGRPMTFEEMDMGWGAMIYSTRLPRITAKSVLTADVHDVAWVFIDGHCVGQIDRVQNERQLVLPPVDEGQQLTLLVEGMGRINFGRAIKDYKGIVGDVTLRAETGGHEVTWKPMHWTSTPVPDDYATATRALDSAAALADSIAAARGCTKAQARQALMESRAHEGDLLKAGYHRGHFTLKKVGDTFLNFETWGKGQVYVNGHAMGRFWSIGPQQTLYVPGCWLRKGRNEVVVLDLAGPTEAVTWGQTTPELNKLQLQRPTRHNDASLRPALTPAQAAVMAHGQGADATIAAVAPGNGWQRLSFATPQRGRHLAIECLATQRQADRTAIAELYLLGTDGQRLSREQWTTLYADSEDQDGNHTGDKAFDLQESTYWQTERKAATPHLLVIDLGAEHTVTALDYLPRAEQGAPGSLAALRVYVY